MQALRRYQDSVEQFPRDVQELQYYFRAAQPGQAVRAVPGEGLEVPLWLLGSSLFSAQLAAAMGLPFAFAAHFAPDHLAQALDVYRSRFRPSEQLSAPYCMAAIPLYAADTESEARLLMSSVQQQFIALRRGTPGPLKPPLADIQQHYSAGELGGAAHALREAVIGNPQQVQEGIRAFIQRTGVNEVMFSSHIFEHQTRLRSIQIAAQACSDLSKAA
jgi:luciferase family oxidoreductase group 1